MFDKDRLQYLHTRGLVRNALSYYESHISPKEWSFAMEKFGKPKTINPNIKNHLNFNVSHTSGVVTLAISKNKIGIDVENVDRELDCLRLARTFFFENKYQYLCNIDCNQQKKRYFDLWTRGFQSPVRHIEF